MKINLFKICILFSLFMTVSFAELNTVRAFPNLQFDQPVDLQSPNDNSNRIFILEQEGEIFVFQNLERNISKVESDFSMATGALVDEKAMKELQKRSENKLKYIGELSGIIDELKSGNLDQICINPLLLAIYHKDEWENVRER